MPCKLFYYLVLNNKVWYKLLHDIKSIVLNLYGMIGYCEVFQITVWYNTFDGIIARCRVLQFILWCCRVLHDI